MIIFHTTFYCYQFEYCFLSITKVFYFDANLKFVIFSLKPLQYKKVNGILRLIFKNTTTALKFVEHVFIFQTSSSAVQGMILIAYK